MLMMTRYGPRSPSRAPSRLRLGTALPEKVAQLRSKPEVLAAVQGLVADFQAGRSGLRSGSELMSAALGVVEQARENGLDWLSVASLGTQVAALVTAALAGGVTTPKPPAQRPVVAPEAASSPWPWVLGVAALGGLAFALSR